MTNEKTLHIVRHGKSTWELNEIEDFDRPLTSKGLSNNYLTASRFAANFNDTDCIITSPATRALSTAICFARSAAISLDKIKLDSKLYFTGTDAVIELIKNVPDECNSLMVVGHNPDLTELANYFVPSISEELPTSSVVSLRFKVESWSQISQAKVTEWFIDYPKKS